MKKDFQFHDFIEKVQFARISTISHLKTYCYFWLLELNFWFLNPVFKSVILFTLTHTKLTSLPGVPISLFGSLPSQQQENRRNLASGSPVHSSLYTCIVGVYCMPHTALGIGTTVRYKIDMELFSQQLHTSTFLSLHGFPMKYHLINTSLKFAERLPWWLW